MSQAISFKVAQHTNKLSSKPATEEQFHSLTLPLSRQRTNWSKKPPGRSRPGTYPNRSCFFCGSKQQHSCDICPASSQTCSCCHKSYQFAGVCQQAAKDNRTFRPAFHKPTPTGPRWEHMRVVEHEKHSYTLLEEGIQYKNCFTLACTSTHWCTYDGPTL